MSEAMMSRKSGNCLRWIVGAGLLIGAAPWAGASVNTVKIGTTDATDGYVQSSGIVNTGNTRIEVGSRTDGSAEVEERGIVEFNLSGLAGMFSTITSAQFQIVDDAKPIIDGTLRNRISVSDNGSVGDIALDHIVGNGEITASDFNSAALSTVGTFLTAADALDGTVVGLTVDVTSQLQDDFANHRAFSAFRLYMPNNGWSDDTADIDVIQFQSQAFNNPAAPGDTPRPRLIITGTPVPEPAAMSILLIGAAGLLGARRRR
ncbi:MAG: PEP-CTERM sorting domain-containing protein [Phycisphaerales bacterium]|jgi:hypothetical protein|nr:PEP-CTERM sorting domain-containing protein [Phycisphaerales bacterium]